MFIGCNAPGWVTEFQHPGGYVPYVDPKPEEMQEYVWGCGYCGYLISLSSGQKLCGRLFARCFTPAGKFSGLQTRRKCITYYILYYYQQCIIHVWRYENCESFKMQHWQNSTNSYKLYLYSRGGTSNAFKVFCSELTDLCRCNGLTVLAQALAKQQNYAKTSISAQDFLCAVGSDFAHRYWHFGLGSHMLFQAYVFCWAFGLVGVI